MHVGIQRHSHTTVQYNARIKKPLMSTPVYVCQVFKLKAVEVHVYSKSKRTQSLKRWASHRIGNEDLKVSESRISDLNLFLHFGIKGLGPTKSLF